MFGAGAAAAIKPEPYIDEIRRLEREEAEKEFLAQTIDPPEFCNHSGVIMDLYDHDILSTGTMCSGVIPNYSDFWSKQ